MGLTGSDYESESMYNARRHKRERDYFTIKGFNKKKYIEEIYNMCAVINGNL